MWARVGFVRLWVKRGIASREELEKTARMTPYKAARAAAGCSSRRPLAPSTAAAPLGRARASRCGDLQSAGALGYDATKVASGSIEVKVTAASTLLSADDKREVLSVSARRQRLRRQGHEQ